MRKFLIMITFVILLSIHSCHSRPNHRKQLKIPVSTNSIDSRKQLSSLDAASLPTVGLSPTISPQFGSFDQDELSKYILGTGQAANNNSVLGINSSSISLV